MKCFSCSGTGKQTLFNLRDDCWACHGSGVQGPEWFQLLLTHKGHGVLGERLARCELSVEDLQQFTKGFDRSQHTVFLERGVSPDQAVQSVQARAKNPCRRCKSFALDEDWVGSGYCSLECCKDDLESDDLEARNYATLILRGYEECAESA